jgi:hypothetical protein
VQQTHRIDGLESASYRGVRCKLDSWSIRCDGYCLLMVSDCDPNEGRSLTFTHIQSHSIGWGSMEQPVGHRAHHSPVYTPESLLLSLSSLCTLVYTHGSPHTVTSGAAFSFTVNGWKRLSLVEIQPSVALDYVMEMVRHWYIGARVTDSRIHPSLGPFIL